MFVFVSVFFLGYTNERQSWRPYGIQRKKETSLQRRMIRIYEYKISYLEVTLKMATPSLLGQSDVKLKMNPSTATLLKFCRYDWKIKWSTTTRDTKKIEFRKQYAEFCLYDELLNDLYCLIALISSYWTVYLMLWSFKYF